MFVCHKHLITFFVMTITALFFPSLADVLLFRTYGVDAPHVLC